MTHQHSDQSQFSSARSDFARRLREHRIPRGFKTARSFARALGIDENRYTRYERAEVEPDLALIRKICELLGIVPNDLLGVADGDPSLNAGFSEPETRPPSGLPVSPPALSAVQRSAWRLAQQFARLQSKQSVDGGRQSHLEVIRHCGEIYTDLMERPYDMISQLVRHPSIDAAPAQQASDLRDLIDQFTSAIDQAPGSIHQP